MKTEGLLDQADSASVPDALDPFTYAYLVSPAHSGSTLLACLVGAHPQVSSVGEFSSEWPKEGLLCSCGKSYFECELWSNWVARARDEGIDFDLADPRLLLHPRPGAGFIEDLFFHQFRWKIIDNLRDRFYRPGSSQRRRAMEYIDRGVRMAKLLCRIQRTDVFFDTTKNPLQVRFLAGYPGLRFKVVSLIRDGRGMVHSLMKHYGKSLDQAIDDWIYSLLNQRRAIAHYMKPETVFCLRLEDFCRDPDGHMKRLFNFLDVDPEAPLECSDPTQRHITGNGMRLSFDGTIRSDESWRKKLTPGELRRFELRAGELNRSQGYCD